MAHLFDKMMSKTRSKSSFEAVSKVVAYLEKLSDSSPEKLQEDIAKCLTLIKVTCQMLSININAFLTMQRFVTCFSTP